MKSITILATALLAVALVGCGTKEEEPTTTPAPEETTSWFDRFRGDEPEEETETTSWFDRFRGEPVVEAPVEEKGWFTKR